MRARGARVSRYFCARLLRCGIEERLEKRRNRQKPNCAEFARKNESPSGARADIDE
jgi:hypothetical protein